MLKKYKLNAVLSSLAIFLPSIFGLVMWDKLPLSLTTHWGADGAADGVGSKAFAVFGLPAILFIIHWVCVAVTLWDWKKKGEQSGKVFSLVLWICPYSSVFSATILYSVALGAEFDVSSFTVIFIGLMFAVIGNYLPKVKRNRTMGVKVKWALESDENWYATHRMAGRMWTVGGLLMILCAFLPMNIGIYVMAIALIVLAIVPVLYSYLYYRKQLREGTAVKTALPKKYGKAAMIIALILGIALGMGIFILLFTGDITVECGEESFTVTASFYEDITVEYDDIDSVEYREKDDKGSRVAGFGSPRLSMGNFENEEFGRYARYSYTACDSAIILRDGEEVLVISCEDAVTTKALYEELIEKMK